MNEMINVSKINESSPNLYELIKIIKENSKKFNIKRTNDTIENGWELDEGEYPHLFPQFIKKIDNEWHIPIVKNIIDPNVNLNEPPTSFHNPDSNIYKYCNIVHLVNMNKNIFPNSNILIDTIEELNNGVYIKDYIEYMKS
jgi:hypothetical protein